MLRYPVEEGEHLAPVGEFHVLLAEVQLQLHQRHDVHHLRAHLLQLGGIAAAHLFQGNVVGRSVLGGDQVRDRLGLGEVHPSVEKGPFGKFSGGGHYRSCGEERPQNLGHNVLGTMAIYLGGILSGVGVGGTEGHCHHLVDDGLGIIGGMTGAFRENNPPVVHLPGPELRSPRPFIIERPEYLVQHLHRLRSADTHYRDRPLSRSRRPGAYCRLLVYCSAVHPIFSLKERHSPREWCAGTCPPA